MWRFCGIIGNHPVLSLRRTFFAFAVVASRAPCQPLVPPFAAALLLYRNDATPWRPLECNSYFA